MVNPYKAWQDEAAFDHAHAGRLAVRTTTGGNQRLGAPAAWSLHEGYLSTFLPDPAPLTPSAPTLVTASGGVWRLDLTTARTGGLFGVYSPTSATFTRVTEVVEVRLVDLADLPTEAPPEGYHLEVEGGDVLGFEGTWRMVGFAGGLASDPQVALVAAPDALTAPDACTPDVAATWARSSAVDSVPSVWTGGVWQTRPIGDDTDTSTVPWGPPSAGGVALVTPMFAPQYGDGTWPDPASPDADRSAQATAWLRAVEAITVHRAAYRWRWVPDHAGSWRLRQRQSLTGADSWPLRQRQNGAHSGAWPLRQRQAGV